MILLPLILLSSPAMSNASSKQNPTGEIVLPQDLNLSNVQQDYGSPGKNVSVSGNHLSVAGTVYPMGLGTHANGLFMINLHGKATEFTSDCGLDDEATSNGSVEFEIVVDGQMKAHSPVMRKGMAPYHFDVALTNSHLLSLVVTDGGDGIDNDHADWLNPEIMTLTDSAGSISTYKPPALPVPQIANNLRSNPELHNALLFGCSPKVPFEYRIPCSGAGVLHFSAKNLPNGLFLNPKTGIITGVIHNKIIQESELFVQSKFGTDHRIMTINSHGLLCLTPPMGWNSWNVWAGAVDGQKMRDAATELRKSRLADFGYNFVNIDDTWEGNRDSNGNITTNKKFGDMKSLADSIHSMGLKLGIYSGPGPTTCAGYPASYQHEQQDANTYAKWGIDYLKYDWCSYSEIDPHPDLNGYKKPYILMGRCLKNTDRDIVFSLCQYGMGNVWNWGRSVGGNLWRTTGDINDSWGAMSANGFGGSKWAKGAGHGGWNDPDMLVVGKLGWGSHPKPTKLTPNEQVTHISLWSMLAAPLIIGCDLTQLDSFTLNLLTNPEVIDVDQDPLGKAGTRLETDNQTEIWTKPLAGGHLAVALFNRGETSAKVNFDFKWAGLTGKHKIRNLWTRKSIGQFSNHFSCIIPRHGCELVKIF